MKLPVLQNIEKMNRLSYLVVFSTLLVGCWARYHDFRLPVNGKRGAPHFATQPSMEVGRRHRNYRQSVNLTYPFELGFGYYYQMDIMLKPDVAENAVPVVNSNIRWPNASVPYVITGNFSPANRTIIMTAMAQYTANTCVRFVPRTTEATYLRIDNNATGCWSYVGRSLNNNYNHVNLQVPTCITTGTVAHELMHALGFYHEFTRPDRDSFVSIDMGALAPQYQTTAFYNANFGKLSSTQALLYDIPYNYGSVMHYSKWGGAVSYSRPVMNNLKPWTGDFGNKVGLVASDIQAVKKMYSCA